MAILTITESDTLSRDSQGHVILAPPMPALHEQKATPGAISSLCESPFTDKTRYIMVNCDVACCLAFGQAPEAVNGLHRMGANETRFYPVQPGHKLAVILSA